MNDAIEIFLLDLWFPLLHSEVLSGLHGDIGVFCEEDRKREGRWGEDRDLWGDDRFEVLFFDEGGDEAADEFAEHFLRKAFEADVRSHDLRWGTTFAKTWNAQVPAEVLERLSLENGELLWRNRHRALGLIPLKLFEYWSRWHVGSVERLCLDF